MTSTMNKVYKQEKEGYVHNCVSNCVVEGLCLKAKDMLRKKYHWLRKLQILFPCQYRQ